MAQPHTFEMADIRLAMGAVVQPRGVTKTRFVKTVTSYKSERANPCKSRFLSTNPSRGRRNAPRGQRYKASGLRPTTLGENFVDAAVRGCRMNFGANGTNQGRIGMHVATADRSHLFERR